MHIFLPTDILQIYYAHLSGGRPASRFPAMLLFCICVFYFVFWFNALKWWPAFPTHSRCHFGLFPSFGNRNQFKLLCEARCSQVFRPGFAVIANSKDGRLQSLRSNSPHKSERSQGPSVNSGVLASIVISLMPQSKADEDEEECEEDQHESTCIFAVCLAIFKSLGSAAAPVMKEPGVAKALVEASVALDRNIRESALEWLRSLGWTRWRSSWLSDCT